jgi:hypothetical protein
VESDAEEHGDGAQGVEVVAAGWERLRGHGRRRGFERSALQMVSSDFVGRKED